MLMLFFGQGCVLLLQLSYRICELITAVLVVYICLDALKIAHKIEVHIFIVFCGADALNNLFELTIFLKCMIRHKHEKNLSDK